jgi:DNA helicase-2/ATP-dependent DNA helicase PcrA
MGLVRPDVWTAVGVDSLEPAADEVVRELNRNLIVVAGPGAGKTELLAQRACFLLQTGICRAHRRILAVSFKRDAAKNLYERVHNRCGDLAHRLDSFTLDAFAKGLVDRFRPAIPTEWRPSIGYEVMTRQLNVNTMRDWIENAGVPMGSEPINVRRLSDGDIRRAFDRLSHGARLPYDAVNPVFAHLGKRWWKEQIGTQPGQPSLTFPMLNRLAAFLLRQNPKLTAALRATYAIVLLDEFQDTTAAQYDLICASFEGSPALLTAVGDSKQRIMVWAGAMLEVFAAYEKDFGARRCDLLRNYRSAPELVQMQHVIAQAVEAGTPKVTAEKASVAGTCVLLEFGTPEEEAGHLADVIADGVRRDGMNPRDFCIIVRQETSGMVKPLKAALAMRDIKLRDESQLQDLLTEPVVRFLLAVLRLGTRERDAEAWEVLTGEIATILGLDDNEDAPAIEREAQEVVTLVRKSVATGRDLSTLPSELVARVGEAALKSAYRQYRSGSYLTNTVAGLAAELALSVAACATPRGAVDDLVGKDVVPAMTIHKSKGLEFHTVIFLGLEDSQWWAFSRQPDEEKRGFFVAFSRATHRVYFTFSDVREGRWGLRQQHRSEIGDLCDVLKTAGVPTINLRSK